MKCLFLYTNIVILLNKVTSFFTIDLNPNFESSNIFPTIMQESRTNQRDEGPQIVEIEIVSPKKSLSTDHKHGFPTKALKDIDVFMDSVINSVIDSIIPEHISSHMLSGSHHNEKNISTIIEFDKEMDQMNKDFDNFFEKSKNKKELKNKKLKRIRNKKEKKEKSIIIEPIKDEKVNEKSNETITIEPEKINKGLTVKKLISYIIKGISYLSALGLLVFLIYFTIFSLFKSNNEKKYEIEGVEDELKSINRERKENKLF